MLSPIEPIEDTHKFNKFILGNLKVGDDFC